MFGGSKISPLTANSKNAQLKKQQHHHQRQQQQQQHTHRQQQQQPQPQEQIRRRGSALDSPVNQMQFRYPQPPDRISPVRLTPERHTRYAEGSRILIPTPVPGPLSSKTNRNQTQGR